MSCTGLQALNPMCQATQAITSAAGSVADTAFTHMAAYFGQSATHATTWLWQQIDSATSLDLRSPALATEMAATTAIAGVLCLGLFLVQVITATLRGHPGGLGRAFTGLIVAFVGSAFALATTRLLIAAVDALADGVVRYTLGTNISGLGTKLSFAYLANINNPATALLVSLVVLAAVVVVWAAMMIRKLMLLLAAVLAPLAFSGATADITRSWVRRWIEFVAAMVVSKLLLVIIFGLGITVLDGGGKNGGGLGQGATQLAGGTVILLLGGLTPWIAIRMFHFAGDSLHAAHATAGQASAGAQTVIAAPQKIAALQSQGRALSSSLPSRSTTPNPGGDTEWAMSPQPATELGGTGSGAAGAAAGGGGVAAASAAAAPAIVAAGAASAVKAASEKSVASVDDAHQAAAPSGSGSGGPDRPTGPSGPSSGAPAKQPPPPSPRSEDPR